jgi:NAD-dependent deacetylase
VSTGQDTAPAAALAELIRTAGSVVALTGAGISVPSGIPDFRSPGTGLWENVDPMEVAHIDVFRRDPERFWSFYGERFQTLEDKQPNRAHRALAALERAGLLDAVITQNIDQLHARARHARAGRGARHDRALVVPALRCPVPVAGRADPAAGRPVRCPRCDCGEPLKPDVVLFGEYLPVDALARAEELAAGADLMLCIGSSLEVYPGGPAPARHPRRRRQDRDSHPGRTPLDAGPRCGWEATSCKSSTLCSMPWR